MTDIPSEVVQVVDNKGEIPKKVAELEQDTEAPEARPYFISFAKYNDKLCEIDYLPKGKDRKALKILKEIGTKIFTKADFQRNKIRNEAVAYTGDYKKLYNKFDEGIEIRELFLSETARIFYFDIEPDRVLYVVAITQNHYETDKVRR